MRTNLFQGGAVEGLDLVVQLFAEPQAPAGPTGLLEGVSQEVKDDGGRRHLNPALLLAGFRGMLCDPEYGLVLSGPPSLEHHSVDGWPTQL